MPFRCVSRAAKWSSVSVLLWTSLDQLRPRSSGAIPSFEVTVPILEKPDPLVWQIGYSDLAVLGFRPPAARASIAVHRVCILEYELPSRTRIPWGHSTRGETVARAWEAVAASNIRRKDSTPGRRLVEPMGVERLEHALSEH